jgi:hypothetical protein
VTYNVVFSLEAAAELIRIAGAVRPSASVIQAADSIRRKLETDPRKAGHLLSEGLLHIDAEPLRAFFVIDDDAMQVEITDFRIV